MGQGKYKEALTSWAQLEKETPDPRMVFRAAMQQGDIQGRYLKNWGQAEAILQRTAKLAGEGTERWEAACQLAIIPFHKKQYRQALEALEGLLKQYPTEQTADFVRPYLWFIKNCTEKKI